MGCSSGAIWGISNLSRTGLSKDFRKGRVHVGSFPGFCTLLVINFKGKAMAISAMTSAIVTKMASTTSIRNPLRLRYRNLKSFIIGLSSSHLSSKNALSNAAKAQHIVTRYCLLPILHHQRSSAKMVYLVRYAITLRYPLQELQPRVGSCRQAALYRYA